MRCSARRLWVPVFATGVWLAASVTLLANPQEYEHPLGWLGEVQANLSQSQYHFVPWKPGQGARADGAQAWSAPNRAHGFRIRIDRTGLRMISRTEPVPTWELRLSLAGYGRGTTHHPVESATLAAQDIRVTCSRDRIVERYLNQRAGLKQAFDLLAPPAVSPREGPAALSLVLGGSVSPRIDPGGQSIDFLSPSGAAVVRYAGLEVRDALGRRLPSWMEVSPGTDRSEIRLLFDDAGAVYPVVVDPLATTPVWTAEPNQESTAFGWAAETAGDVNGDGYSDVIVGAYAYDNDEVGEGRVFVYHGSPSGLTTTPAWTAEGDQPGANFGRAVAAAGDVNGDGYDDVIIGSVYYDNVETNEGRAFVYHGSPTGLAATPAWTAEPDQDDARIIHVARAGDVNGDGYSDVDRRGRCEYDNGADGRGPRLRLPRLAPPVWISTLVRLDRPRATRPAPALRFTQARECGRRERRRLLGRYRRAPTSVRRRRSRTRGELTSTSARAPASPRTSVWSAERATRPAPEFGLSARERGRRERRRFLRRHRRRARVRQR